jgi:ElaB/YqjD/DUF883 family membrane-anchored ribosome-binding protein
VLFQFRFQPSSLQETVMNGSANGGHASDSTSNFASGQYDELGPDGATCNAAGQTVEDLKQRAAEYIEQGREKAVEAAAGIERQIRDRPVGAVAIAAGIGFALGLLWSRRS